MPERDLHALIEGLRDEAARVAVERANGKDVSSRDTSGSIIWQGADAIERLADDRDGWKRIVGQIAATVPLKHVIGVTGSVGDLIAFIEKSLSSIAAKEAEIERLRAALEEIAKTNQVREFMGDDKNDGYGNEGWVVRDGQYARIARAALNGGSDAP